MRSPALAPRSTATADGLFNGQSRVFFDLINRLAREADAAERRIG